jgi:hypothetical protein
MDSVATEPQPAPLPAGLPDGFHRFRIHAEALAHDTAREHHGATIDPANIRWTQIIATTWQEAWRRFADTVQPGASPKLACIEQQQPDGSWKLVYRRGQEVK